ncbi:Uncharacterised protein [Turicibacter sanguinis]|nr:Uncharacterised protein [Turicibacter sanguinis]
MASNLYFYGYENLEDIIDYIDKYENVYCKYHTDFTQYTVKVYRKDLQKLDGCLVNLYSKVEIINFIIIPKLKIISVITEKYSYIKNFYNSNKLLKINLLNNNTFYTIFENKFSNNLMKLSMSTENLNAIINEIELIGSELHKSDILYNMNSYIFDKSTHLNKYSFKPTDYNFIINVTSTNKIEIRDNKAKKEDIIRFTYEFISYLAIYGGLHE